MQEREPIVSIIVPAYNSERYIRPCLDSLLPQNCNHVEVIAIDDGSTDTTPEILHEYEADSRVRVIRQDNQGVSAARNKGLSLAHGEFVAFVDSDDVMHPLFVETCLGLLLKEERDFVLYDLKEFNDGEKPVFETIDDAYVDVVDNPLKYYVANGFKGGVSSIFVRRRLISGLLFPFGISMGEDLCFSYLLLPRLLKGYHIHVPLYYYRRTSGSLDSAGMNVNDVSGFSDIIRTLYKFYLTQDNESRSLLQHVLFPKLVKNLVKRGVRLAGEADAMTMERMIVSLLRERIFGYKGFSLRWRWYLWRISRRWRPE